jgi:hypothetical protein
MAGSRRPGAFAAAPSRLFESICAGREALISLSETKPPGAGPFSARAAGGDATDMADHLFVPQSVLYRWSEQGRVSVDGSVLTILGENRSFSLTSAVRFIKLEVGDDKASLLQKVKTLDALKQMGAEHYLESVLLGDCAYQVQQGFLADANALRRAASASTPPPISQPKAATPVAGASAAGAQPAREGDRGGSEPDELLAQFLLDNLT